MACSFKEEIEQMRTRLKPWQVAELLLAVERVKDHPELKLESIFTFPKEEDEIDNSYKKGSLSESS